MALHELLVDRQIVVAGEIEHATIRKKGGLALKRNQSSAHLLFSPRECDH